jgi:hypothetical protein
MNQGRGGKSSGHHLSPFRGVRFTKHLVLLHLWLLLFGSMVVVSEGGGSCVRGFLEEGSMDREPVEVIVNAAQPT